MLDNTATIILCYTRNVKKRQGPAAEGGVSKFIYSRQNLTRSEGKRAICQHSLDGCGLNAPQVMV